MGIPKYLVDTSVLARLSKPNVALAFSPFASSGQVGICAPVAFEIGFSARTHADYVSVADRLFAFTQIPVTDADHRRSLEVQRALSAKGQHRTLSLVDALVAAVAEARQMTVLHYDSDYERIAAITGQATQWIVPNGAADAPG
jgi:predicted nucleic acid-binding protein